MSREVKGRILTVGPNVIIQIPNDPELRISLGTEVIVVLPEGACPQPKETK